MAYIYLLNLYKEIDERQRQIDLLISENSGITPYEQGRKDILKEFRIYLTENMNSKLPKRIRRRLAEEK